jgi:hypothetical protein
MREPVVTRIGRVAALGALALVVGSTDADARRYRGERYDVFSGQVIGKWIIVTRELQGDAVLDTRVRCRPARRCRPFPRRLRLELVRTEEFTYTGTFRVGAVACGLDAYVYPQGFEGTYACDDQTFGSISGRSRP